MEKPINTMYPNMPANFPNLCKAARIELGYSLRKVGIDMGKHSSGVHQLENGNRNFDYETAMKFKEYYGLKIDLPTPDSSQRKPVVRNRAKRPILKGDGFYISIGKELIEVVTYRKIGEVSSAIEYDAPSVKD